MVKRSRAKSEKGTKKRVRTDGEVVSWDVTCWEAIEPEKIAKTLRELAKRWVFQREESKEKKAHYQIRMSLYHKKSLSGTTDLLKQTCLKGSHLSPTAGVNSKNFNYVMKLDSRIDGPWKDTDPDPDQVDKQVFYQNLPWQQDCTDFIKGEVDERKIRIYLDKGGKVGKSTMIKKIRYNKLGTIIPPTMEKAEDISAMIMCKPVDRCYVVDLPKCIIPSKMNSFWSALETVKDGYCSDKRNRFRDRVFKTPHVIVFTNNLPPRAFLSEDRWEIIDLSNLSPNTSRS